MCTVTFKASWEFDIKENGTHIKPGWQCNKFINCLVHNSKIKRKNNSKLYILGIRQYGEMSIDVQALAKTQILRAIYLIHPSMGPQIAQFKNQWNWDLLRQKEVSSPIISSYRSKEVLYNYLVYNLLVFFTNS